MSYAVFAGALATIVGIIGYVPYFRDIIRGETKPHVFSWLIWGMLTATSFFAQIVSDAGPGAWVMGITMVADFAIAGFAFFRGEKGITRTDWLCFLGAILGIVLWRITDNPLSAVITVSIVDFLGFLPTFRKALKKPYEETLTTFTFAVVKFVIGITALQSFELVNWLYPAMIAVTNAIFVAIILFRRRKIAKTL